ncbi:UDP:flavonoid glycosyltransferase YjiC, YdhE family [Geosmithia morbida]|uniref:UDP:flavonoid glycosyltransferase YjiC, YdhE family n=1 Tax=Geosmithia morbida TaxID=1094350 RepID=A0A9P4YTE9_9HYPO|nr:UDP:flavonoid glycosyltransferase YjiC, YdhE family [Geosmithia morbida]KAF4121720.1 UDP:flavonoid glycosyltransferase YjiC, YdhE family [Geosmithia morbida]
MSDAKLPTPEGGLSSRDAEALISDEAPISELEGQPASKPQQHDDPPPTYGESHSHMRFSQPGFEADASLTDAGRVSININTKNRRLADLLAPSIASQAAQDSGPTPSPAYIPPSLGGWPGQRPPTRLNVVVQIVGSRGDVQPFVALGKVLKDTYGHRVRIATHPTFKSFVEDSGLEFFSIGGDPAELMAFMVKHPGLMPGFDAIKSGEITRRRKGIADMILGCWRSCIESGDGSGPAPLSTTENIDLYNGIPRDDGRDPFVADAIIANPPSFAHIHIAEKLGIPLHMMFTMPWTPTRAFQHPLADIASTNADDVMTKYLSYTFVEMMTWQGLGDVINRFRTKVLDLSPLSLMWAPGLLNRLRIPYTYCWSPALIPKPNDWGSNIDISGFFFLDLASSFTPDPELGAFLEAGPPPVYIGFGSIVVDDPDAMTQMIFDAVKASGVRALVSKGWGGLGADDIGVPEGVFMLGNVPHDWLFQHVSCVVHHGGAGTTAAGIKAGKPTAVVPFFGDQPFWGSMISRAKAGPEPIAYKNLTAEKLAEAIKFCLKPETVQQAKIYGEKIREEKGTDVGGQSFHNHLDIDALRCSIAPSRTAIWRIRRSKVRLSGLAAAVLVKAGHLQYSDLKLYRSREYNTEDQPPDPISAATCSLVMDASGIGLAIADMPRELFKGRSRKTTEDEDSASTSPAETPQAGTASAAKNPGSHHASTPTDSQNPLRRESSSADAPSDGTAQTGKTSNDRLKTSRESSPRDKRPSPSREPSPSIGMDTAIGAGRSVGRIVTTGVKTPMNFCLGLAKGFRNIPRLYNDDTVRQPEKVTDFGSGIKVATKEFGFGLYDGISGLVTQPMRAAEKEGASGLIKGFGKGIGGLITKPAAGAWAVPAYTMQGVHAQVTKLFAKSNENYIITSRIIQSQRDLAASSAEERDDIVGRWSSGAIDRKTLDRLRKKDYAAQGSRSPSASAEPSSSSYIPHDLQTTIASARAGWMGKLSLLDERLRDERSKYNSRKEGKRPVTAATAAADQKASEDAEFEQAILASVSETSRGNPEEDAAVEDAIRQSVNAVRERGELPDPVMPAGDTVSSEKDPNIFEDKEYQITDEEYRDLIEKAIRESMVDGGPHFPQESGLSEAAGSARRHDDDGDFKRAMEESRKAAEPPAYQEQPPQHGDGNDDEAELQRAIEASRSEADREKREEEIVMDYVKKQSVAEEEIRKSRQETGKKSQDDDGDLERAIEESLRVSGKSAGEGSGSDS